MTWLPGDARVGDDGHHVAEHRRIVALLDAILAGGRDATADRLGRVDLTGEEQVRAALAGWLPPESVTDPRAATQVATRDQLLAAARAAVASNRDYLALAPPSTAEAVAQVAALTRQTNALIRLVARDLTNDEET